MMRINRDASANSINRFMGADTLDVDPPKAMLGLLIGFTVGFVIAAAIVVVFRGLENEADGIRALTHSLMIAVPSLTLAIVVGFAQRKQTKRTISRPAMLVSCLGGLGFGAAMWIVSPTEESLVADLLEANRDLIDQRANQLAKFHASINEFETSPLSSQITKDQAAALQRLALSFYGGDFELTEQWNTLLTTSEEFARLKPGVAPEDVMASWDRPKSQFKSDPYDFATDSPVDQIAEVAFGESYLWLSEAEYLVRLIRQMRYVCIVRIVELHEPALQGFKFQPGLMRGQAFVFDCQQDTLVSGFDFEATNSEMLQIARTEYSQFEFENELREHSVAAFWIQVHGLIRNAESNYQNVEVPYSDAWLQRTKNIVANLEASNQNLLEPTPELGNANEPGTATSVDEIKLTDQQQQEILELLSISKLKTVIRLRELSGAPLSVCKQYVEQIDTSVQKQ